MSASTPMKIKHTRRPSKQLAEDVIGKLEGLIVAPQIALPGQESSVSKTLKGKLSPKKIAPEEEALATESTNGGIKGSISSNSGAPEQIIAQSASIVSDASGSSSTPIDLTTSDSSSADSSAIGSELSTAQIVGLGALGVIAVGGITAIAISSNRSSSNNTDTTAPQIQSINSNVAKNTIQLTYNEALDPNHQPSINAFSITTNGAANFVTGITVSDNVMTLTLANPFTTGAVTIGYTDATNGNDANAIQDTSGNDATGFIQGISADGYISGAKIYIDSNGDGSAQETEFTGVISDALGNFFLPNTLPKGSLISVGGTNIDTGLPQLTPLKAPAGSAVINPLTTLLDAYIKVHSGSISITDASESIAASFGLVLPFGTNFTTYNPLAGTTSASEHAQEIAAQIATLVNLASGSNSTVADAVFQKLATTVNGSNIDLSNAATITTLLTGVSNADTTAITRIAENNLSIHNASNLDEISAIQAGLGDFTIPGTPTISLTPDNTINDGISWIRISLTGTNAKPGYVVELHDVDAHQTNTVFNSPDVTLYDTDIARGYIDVPLDLASGTHDITAHLITGSQVVGSFSPALRIADESATLPTSAASTLSSNINFDYSEALIASQFSKAAYDHRIANAMNEFLVGRGWLEIGSNSELTVANAYGFAAKHVSTNGSIDYMISFEGSNTTFDEIKDWTSANASEYGWSKYYESLIPLIKQVLTDALAEKRAGKDVEISFTGHSLGGAAACVAYADLFCDPSKNLWNETSSPLGLNSRIYSQFSASDAYDIRSILLPSIDAYTFGAPSFLVEPTKMDAGEYATLAAKTFVTSLTPTTFPFAAINFFKKAMESITVNSALLPDLTNYGQHVFQFEHKDSTAGTYNDPVAEIGTYDAGTNIALDLADIIYTRYGGSKTNPIATHSIDFYGETIARLLENDTITKSGLQLLISTTASNGNDFLLNSTGINSLAGNDDLAYTNTTPNSGASFTTTAGTGDDIYTINNYGIDLTINGAASDGADTIYFALAGVINAQAVDTNNDSIADAVKFNITNIKNGVTNSSSVTVKNWSNHYIDQVAQINESTNGAWNVNYFDMAKINESEGVISVANKPELNGLVYHNVDGYGQPFVMAVPDMTDWKPYGTSLSLPSSPLIQSIDGDVSFKVNGTFNPLLPTYVYTHGWTDNARVDDTTVLGKTASIKAKLIYDAYISQYGTGDSKTANIVMANWETIATTARDPNETTSEPTFESSVTKQVGEVIADALIRAGANMNTTTLVGHSLGSFVMGAAANEIVQRTGLKVSELVALDTAATNPLFPEYDIDARNGYARSIFGSGDAPYDFTEAIAQHTTSYTVIDNTNFGGASGNNDRAATADSAYLIVYDPTDAGWSTKATSPYHNGVVAAYADLIREGDLNPSNANTALTNLQFNNSGEAVTNGIWDGILAVYQPWLASGYSDTTFIPAKSIGWINNIDNPTLYGSVANDVMFFDKFETENRTGAKLVGGSGNDLIGSSTGRGVDRFVGGDGSDQFFFGYTKNQSTILPFLDGAGWGAYKGGMDAYAIIEDMNQTQDTISFGWSSTAIGYKLGSSYANGFNNDLDSLYGEGVAFYDNRNNADLVAYVPGMTTAQASQMITENKILFNTIVNLDNGANKVFFDTPAAVIG